MTAPAACSPAGARQRPAGREPIFLAPAGCVVLITEGWLVTNLVAGAGADYAFDAACSSSSEYLRVYRIVAGVAYRLGTTADDLLGGPHHAWAVTYLAQYTELAPELTPLNGGRAVTLKTRTDPVADTAAGLVVVAYHERAGRPDTVELVDPKPARWCVGLPRAHRWAPPTTSCW